jgi:hypothetical protein
MITNMLASATALSNRDLLDRLPRLAASERATAAQLVAHLAALDMRPDVYAAEGYGSLFQYCTRALRLSEDAACTRLAAVSACRRFPRILDLLISGTLSLTNPRRRNDTGCSSRSAGTPTSSSGDSRRCCAARSRAAIPA